MKRNINNILFAFLLSFGMLFMVPFFCVAAEEPETEILNESEEGKNSVDTLSDGTTGNPVVQPVISDGTDGSFNETPESVIGEEPSSDLTADPMLSGNDQPAGSDYDTTDNNDDFTPVIPAQDQDPAAPVNTEPAGDLPEVEGTDEEPLIESGTVNPTTEGTEPAVITDGEPLEDTDITNHTGEESDEIDPDTEESAPSLRSGNIALLSQNGQSVSNLSLEAEPSQEEEELTYIDGVIWIKGNNIPYEDFPVYYHYSDGYFRDHSETDEDGNVLENAYIYDDSLNSMSGTAAVASWPSRFVDPTEGQRYANMSRNAQDLLRQLGFENIEINDRYESQPIINGVMLVSGQKKVVYDGKEYTLIAIFPDSGTANPEWPMNIELGNGDYHEGFHYGASEVFLPYLKDYIERNNISGDLKVWSSGISRGGAIANVAGGLLDIAIDEGNLYEYLPDTVNLDKKNIYVYTFGTPPTVSKEITWNKDSNGNYTTRKDTFDNLHSFENAFDFIIHYSGDEWDMDVFGDRHVNSMHGEGILSEDAFYEKVQELGWQWVNITGTDPEDLYPSRDLLSYDAETQTFSYLPLEYRSSVLGVDMETYINLAMRDLAPVLTRDFYKNYLQPGLNYFFGTSYEAMGPMSAAISAETDRLIADIKVKVPELILKGIRTFDFSELREYLNLNVNPANAIPQIIINSFRINGIPYNYDFEKNKYTEELLDDAEMRKVLWSAITTAAGAPFDLLSRLRLRDALAILDFYEISQAGYEILASGHDVGIYYAWSRVLDDTTRNNSNIYDIPMKEHDAWGYQMLNLPETGSYTVRVYDSARGTEDSIYAFTISNGVISNVSYGENPDWFIHVGTGAGGAYKTLYLRTDHAYQVVFSACEGAETMDFSVDEWSSHYYYDVFKPVNHITEAKDGTSFTNLKISTDADERQDDLIVSVGELNQYPEMGEDVQGPLADYALAKVIRILAKSGIDGEEISSAEYHFNNNDDPEEFTATAGAVEGYAFDGWYVGERWLTNDYTYSQSFSFADMGMTLVARYHLISEGLNQAALMSINETNLINSDGDGQNQPLSSVREDQLVDARSSQEGTETDLGQTVIARYHQIVSPKSVSTSSSRSSAVISSTGSDAAVYASVSAPNTGTVRRTAVPNTADDMISWIFRLFGSLSVAFGALFLLTREA